MKLRRLLIYSFPIQFLAVATISFFPDFVTKHYTFGAYQSFAAMLRKLSGLTSFPIGQFVFYALLMLLVVLITREGYAYRKRSKSAKMAIKHAAINAGALLSLVYFALMCVWGLNYFQRSLADKLGYEVKQEYSQSELEQLTDELIDTCNALRTEVQTDEAGVFTTGLSTEELFEQSIQAYQSLPKSYQIFDYHTPSIKAVKIPQLMSFFGVSGIYFPFTGEANVNMDIPEVLLPSTITHEMSHQIGVAEEGEANYLAYVSCINHPEISFQYSGNYLALHYCLRSLYRMDSLSYKIRKQNCHPGIRRDARHLQKYWRSYQNPIEPWTDQFYDFFLKANQQKKGIESYSGVVALIIAHKRRGFRSI